MVVNKEVTPLGDVRVRIAAHLNRCTKLASHDAVLFQNGMSVRGEKKGGPFGLALFPLQTANGGA